MCSQIYIHLFFAISVVLWSVPVAHGMPIRNHILLLPHVCWLIEDRNSPLHLDIVGLRPVSITIILLNNQNHLFDTHI